MTAPTPATNQEPMCYIATKRECGCIVASILVGSTPAKVLGKQVAAWIEEGYNAEYVTHSYVTENWGICDHRPKQLPLTEQPPTPPAADITYDVTPEGTVENLSLNGAEPYDGEAEPEADDDETQPIFADYTDHDDLVMAEFAADETD